MTLSDFEQELIARGFDSYGSVSLDRYINWAYSRVAMKSRWTWEETTGTFTLNPGASFYDLTALPQLKTLSHLYVTTASHQKRVRLALKEKFFEYWLGLDLTATSNQGEPQYYYIWNNKLYILPPLNATRDFTIHYFQRPVKLTNSTDVTLMPEWLDEAVVMAALVECHRRANETDMMNNAIAQLGEFFDQMLTEEEFSMGEQQDRVRKDNSWL